MLVGNQPHPRHVLFVERPGILERGTGGLAPDRCGVGAVAVERRVQVDQVHRLGVDAPEYVQVVAGPDRARREVARRLAEQRIFHASYATRVAPNRAIQRVSAPAGAAPTRAPGFSIFQQPSRPGGRIAGMPAAYHGASVGGLQARLG